MSEHVEVLVVGAGLSGISAGWHLKTHSPQRSFLILESRERIGGTWDLFRYPGIRSDSDMYTLGYSFQPWKNAKAIADGPSILDYVRDTAREHGIDTHIRFQQRVVGANWSSNEALWTVEVERGAAKEKVRYTCNFLYFCSGYYDYAQGFRPHFPGEESFRGTLVHPQHWPESLDYDGKKVVVIGSGATAVTLVPSMAERAAHVTMLQRSPTYIITLPARDKIANALRSVLPAKLAYGITRWKNVLFGMLFFWLCRHRPHWVKGMIRRGLRRELGPDFPLTPHFKPSYNPWDQRLCLVPDGDLFAALRRKRASIVTDRIKRFTADGIELESGAKLDADIIVTATGLNLVPLGGAQIAVDGQPMKLGDTLNYKGMMLSDVPNLAFAVGYTNASWTLKCDLVSSYVCRVLNAMDAKGVRQCAPHNNDASVQPEPLINFSSGYVTRAIESFPKQGSKKPWRLYQNYALDLVTLRFGKVDDGALRFSHPRAPSGARDAAREAA